jgi:glutaredoxin
MGKRITVENLNKDDCCLCKEVKKALKEVQKIRAFDIKEVDIASDTALLESYKEEIPAVLINGRRAFKCKVDKVSLLNKLDKVLNRG